MHQNAVKNYRVRPGNNSTTHHRGSLREFLRSPTSTLNSSKLKTTQVYINEDLCESSVQLRKGQLPELKKARLEGKVTYFSHTKLVIKEKKVQRSDSPTTNSVVHDGKVNEGGAASASVLAAVTAQLPFGHKKTTGVRLKCHKTQQVVPQEV